MPEAANWDESSATIDSALPIPAGYLADSAFPERIRVIVCTQLDTGAVFLRGVGTDTGRFYERVIAPDRASELNLEMWQPDFNGNAKHFQLVIEACRLEYAPSYDPLFALNNSAVVALPHQLEAVYQYMLPQPRIRHLMAHDAGAGKTVMCGLIFRELSGRNPSLRTFVVAPAGLTRQWKRELKEKFLVDFQILDRDLIAINETILSDNPRLITSIAFARQDNIRRVFVSTGGISFSLTRPTTWQLIRIEKHKPISSGRFCHDVRNTWSLLPQLRIRELLTITSDSCSC